MPLLGDTPAVGYFKVKPQRNKMSPVHRMRCSRGGLPPLFGVAPSHQRRVSSCARGWDDITGDFGDDFFQTPTRVTPFIKEARGGLCGFKGEWGEIENAPLCTEGFHFCAGMPIRGDALWEQDNE